MDAEIEDELGYSKYDYKNKRTENSRNGSYKKTVSSSQGDIELEIPRDRNGEYEPQIVKKHQMDISNIEDKIIFLYSQGISTRDIEKTMQEMYGIEVNATRVSKITDKLLPLIRGWQNRPLETHLQAPTEESALESLDELERGWGAKYLAAIRSWREHWDELATMFKYPEQIRWIIYTTNAIENFNRQLRKATKTKSAFVSDDSLLK